VPAMIGSVADATPGRMGQRGDPPSGVGDRIEPMGGNGHTPTQFGDLRLRLPGRLHRRR
jgi:hypothetical protein